MIPGALQHEIILQAPDAGQDSVGQPVTTWTTFATVRAHIRDATGRQFAAAQAMQNAVYAEITIRYLPGVTPSMRVLHGTDVYDIESILGQDRFWLTLMCARGKGTDSGLVGGSGLVEKVVPVDADSFGLSDSESAGILRKFTWASLKAALVGIFATAAKGVTNGDAHDHNGGDGAQISYGSLSGLPTLGNSAPLNVGTTAGTVAAGNDSRIVSATPAETTTTMGALINSATADSTPVDADQIGIMDSTAANVLKKLSWAAMKTSLASIFATLAGKSGGQTINGGTAASENLTLRSTAHATKGKITALPLTLDEENLRVGIGQTSPAAALHIKAGTATANTAPMKLTSGPLLTVPEAGAVEYLSGAYYLTNAAATPLRRKFTSEEYVLSRGLSLITNGSGGMLDNTNFSNYTYDQNETYSGAGCFRINIATGVKFSDEYIPIELGKRYVLSVYAKSGDVGGGNYNAVNKQYFGLALYDIDKNSISDYHASKYAGSTDTTLAAALNPGDTTITLTDATGWSNGGYPSMRNIAWFGYVNTYGYTYPDYTYTRLTSNLYSSNFSLGAWGVGGITGNVITLRVPWAGPSLAMGAAVRNVGGGGTYKYTLLNNVSVPNTWTSYTGQIGPGVPIDSVDAPNLFRPGTAFVRFLHLVNYHGTADNNVRLSELSFVQTSSSNIESQIGVGATYKTSLQSALPANGLAVEGKIGSGTLSPAALISGYGTTEQARASYDATTYVGTLVSSTGLVTETLAGAAASIKWLYSDATTNAIYALATFAKNSTGAGAAGLGVSITLAAKSSTTVDMPQVTLAASWLVATHATRTSRGTLNSVDYAGTREAMRWESDGSAARIGFFGAAAILKPTALTTTVAAAPAGGTGTSAGGWDTSGNRDLAIATINNLKTRVDQLESKLQALGLLA